MIKLKQKDLIDKKFLGISYKLNSRTLEENDCAGLIVKYLEDNGISIHDLDKPVHREWFKTDPELYVKELLKEGDIVPLNRLRKFDIIMFTLEGKRRIPTHAGVMINNGWFLHILEDKKSEVIQLNKFWLSKYCGSIRIRAVLDKLKEVPILLEKGQAE